MEEIENAISGLAPEEYRRLVEWFRAREQVRWDKQMDRDSSSGKLGFLLMKPKMRPSAAWFASGRPYLSGR